MEQITEDEYTKIRWIFDTLKVDDGGSGEWIIANAFADCLRDIAANVPALADLITVIEMEP